MPKERAAITSLSLIMAFRMLGLFMILPVFSAYASKLPGGTPVLIGLALGVYGLTQAILQIPFGMLSDRIGRKPVIAGGLILFAIGSVVAALSHSIHGIIIGRAIQGAGAIGSTTLAMVADLTRDENRSKAMAMMGMTIGIAFTIAMVLGPIVNTWFHLAGIFWLTAALAIIGVILVFTGVPTPPKLVLHKDIEAQPSRFKAILKNPQLLRLDAGIFCLHAILTAFFIAIPILLTHLSGISQGRQAILYFIVLVVAFVAAVPLIVISEKRRQLKNMFAGAIATLIFTQLLLWTLHQSTVAIAIILFIFFAAFTLLEASLPSLVSKISPIRNKGTAMGVYSSSQFLGIFIGGSLGGIIFSHFAIAGIFVFCALLGLIWLLLAITMQQPPYWSTMIVALKPGIQLEEVQRLLGGREGIAELAYMQSEQQIYLKIDQKIISKPELRKCLEEGNLA